MRILEIAVRENGKPKLVARLSEDGTLEGDEMWKSIIHRRKELGLDRLAQRLDNGYIMARIIEDDSSGGQNGTTENPEGI